MGEACGDVRERDGAEERWKGRKAHLYKNGVS